MKNRETNKNLRALCVIRGELEKAVSCSENVPRGDESAPETILALEMERLFEKRMDQSMILEHANANGCSDSGRQLTLTEMDTAHGCL